MKVLEKAKKVALKKGKVFLLANFYYSMKEKTLEQLAEEVEFLRWVITTYVVNGETQLQGLFADWKKKQGLARDLK